MKKNLIGVLVIFATSCARYSSEEWKIFTTGKEKLIGTTIFVNCDYETTLKDIYLNEDELVIETEETDGNKYLTPISEKTSITDFTSLKNILSRKYRNGAYEYSFCSQEDFYKTDYGKKASLMRKLVKTPDTSLLENKDPRIILGKYIKISDMKDELLKGENRYSWSIESIIDGIYDHWDSDNMDIDEMQKVVNPTKPLKCFIKEKEWGSEEEYENNTDECIVVRRNNKDNEIWFNYKKYLPQIKNDEHFNKVMGIFNWYYKVDIDSSEFVQNSYCLNQKEITTQERNQCIKNTDIFFNKVLAGNASHCRDKNKEGWNELLENSNELKSFLNGILSEDLNKSNAHSLEKAIYNSFYSSLSTAIAIDKINNFGRDNFCVVDGWENDLAKLLKKNTNKSKSYTVELN